MDPWTTSPVAAAVDSAGGEFSFTASNLATPQPSGFENSFLTFENVKDHGAEIATAPQAVCPRLPDSVEYVARLEAKLSALRVRPAGGGKSSSCRQQQLGKEAAIASLLRSDSRQLLLHGLGGTASAAEDLDLEEAVAINTLLRHISPQQPVTRGETVHLVTADQLDRRQEAAGAEVEKEESQQL